MNQKLNRASVAEEWIGAGISFLYFFCVLAAYYVIRPLRDQLAVELGADHLPWFFAATFIATLLLTPIFSWVVSRWPRKIVMPLVNLFFVVCQLVFIPLFQSQNLIATSHLGLIFFVWTSVFNLFVVSVFWSFMSDIWDDDQARRFYPIIALGGTVGAIVGPLITGNLVALIGTAHLLAVSAGLLFITVLCVLVLGKWAHDHGVHRSEPGNGSPLGGGMLDGLKQVFGNPFIAAMSVMMLLNDVIGTIAYVLITEYSGYTFPHDSIAQTRFAAHMDLAANVIQIIVQIVVTRWLLIRYGAGSVIALWGVIIVTACLTMVLVNDPYAIVIGIMPWVAVVQIITRSLSYGMLQPARETLYTMVPRELRYKGKNAVDTVVWRAGDVVSSSAINLFRGWGVTVVGFGVAWAALAATSGILGWWLADRVEQGKLKK